jgi:predicted transcriptional regulator/DNA-binding XRE family transcriptional regulator
MRSSKKDAEVGLSMTKQADKVVKAVRVSGSDAGRIVGKSLRDLRERAGLTQIQMAYRLNVGQAAVSKIEHRGDVQISSLQKYVEALGAELRIDAAFPPNIDPNSDQKKLGAGDNQLVLPIFRDERFDHLRDVVLSIKPQYTSKILEGEKTVELRRRFPAAPKGTIAYIYCTSPVRAIIGRAEITEIIKLPVDEIWREYHASASVDKSDFDSYFSGINEGFALKFANAEAFSRRLELPELRERFGFEPPQSFLYATPVLRKAIRDEYPNVSH